MAAPIWANAQDLGLSTTGDQTANMQSILDTSFPDAGGVLFVPFGEYTFSGTVIWPESSTSGLLKPIQIIGEGLTANAALSRDAGSTSPFAGGVKFIYDGSGATFFDLQKDSLDADTTDMKSLGVGFMGLALHDEGTGTTTGLKFGRLNGASLQSMSFDGFAKGMHAVDVGPGNFYNIIKDIYCRSCTTGFEFEEIVNGQTFYDFKSSGCGTGFRGGVGSAASTGVLYSFFGGYSELNDGAAFEFNNTLCVNMYGHYFENNQSSGTAGDGIIKFRPNSGAEAGRVHHLGLFGGYARGHAAGDNKPLIEQIDGAGHLYITLQNLILADGFSSDTLNIIEGIANETAIDILNVNKHPVPSGTPPNVTNLSQSQLIAWRVHGCNLDLPA